MYSTIKQIRHHGVRRPDREIFSDAGVSGVLTLASVAGHYVLSVHALGDDSHQVPLIPKLYDAVLVSLHGSGMLFRGFQRAGGPAAPTYAQEWTVTICAEAPEGERDRLRHRRD
jgi:hypothetical protein